MSVLVITDSVGIGDIEKMRESFERESLTIETIHADKYFSILEKEWKAIVLLFDSVSKGLRVAKQIRESKIHTDTPMVYWQPSPMKIGNLSLVHGLDFIATATGSVLKTRAELKKTAA